MPKSNLLIIVLLSVALLGCFDDNGQEDPTPQSTFLFSTFTLEYSVDSDSTLAVAEFLGTIPDDNVISMNDIPMAEVPSVDMRFELAFDELIPLVEFKRHQGPILMEFHRIRIPAPVTLPEVDTIRREENFVVEWLGDPVIRADENVILNLKPENLGWGWQFYAHQGETSVILQFLESLDEGIYDLWLERQVMPPGDARVIGKYVSSKRKVVLL